MSEMNDFFKRVNQDKSKNIPLFDRNEVTNIHEKVVNRIKRVKDQKGSGNNLVDGVIQADKAFREALKDLITMLYKLDDKEVATTLIAEHIMMLDSVFKDFEK